MSDTPWFDMQEAFWQFLRSKHDYAALLFQEFPFHQGRMLPFDVKTAMVNYDRLPCHATLVTGGGTQRSQGKPEGWFQDYCKLRGVVIYRADESDRSTRSIERAMQVIETAIDVRRPNALTAALGTPGQSGGWYEWALGEGPVPVPRWTPTQWSWTYDITLLGASRHR